MAVKEFLDAVDKKKKEEEAAMAADAPVSAEVVPEVAAPSVFGTPAPLESVVDTVGQVDVQSPFSRAAAVAPNPMAVAVDPTAQPDVLASTPAVQAPAVQAETPLFQPTESGRRLARGVGSAVDAVASAGSAAMDAGSNFANSSSDAVSDLISQSTGGRINLQSSPEFGQASTSTAGAPITDASQLSEFMSGLNEQAQIQAPTQVAAPTTPVPTANFSVNGTDAVTPEATTEAGQAAPVAVAPQVPQVGSGGMITRDLTGESFIGGSRTAATPEEVAAFNKMSLAANTDEAARERMRYNAPTIAAQAEKAAAVQAERDQPKAPVRLTEQERKLKEKRSEATFRKEAKKDIRAKVRDFGQTNSMAKTREFERSLNKKLDSDVIANRDYNRATEEADLAAATAQYNRGTLTAAQRATLGKQTANEQKLSSIRAANPSLSDADAAAIAAGVVRVVQNPLSGETQLLNIATGESRKVGAEQGTDVDFDVAVPEKTLYGRIGQFTGAVEGTKRKLQALGGQVGVDVATDESLEAAQDFKAAQNQLVRAFKQSDRYSATESKQLKEELGIDLSLFEDPKTAEAKLRSADQTLARNYENEIATYQDTSFPSKDRQDARLRAKAIAEFRALIGVPEKGATPVEGGTAPANIDAGDWKYMTEEQRKLFN